ncbi:hypothetical protein [Anaerorhabdus sp.]|uniref:hypothetical protein n=1 Tax=Anaerorhabdus sp. TaxID=1872524 RepID=UPI002FCBAE61
MNLLATSVFTHYNKVSPIKDLDVTPHKVNSDNIADAMSIKGKVLLGDKLELNTNKNGTLNEIEIPPNKVLLGESQVGGFQANKGTSGIGVSKYATAIDDKVSIINKKDLPESLGITFTDAEYRTVITNEEVKVYRTFGGRADAVGGFATTYPSNSRIESKIDLALLPEWGNTRAYEAEISIPIGQELTIGKVALKKIKGTGTVLQGGADQILLPKDWPPEWITRIRNVSS